MGVNGSLGEGGRELEEGRGRCDKGNQESVLGFGSKWVIYDEV